MENLDQSQQELHERVTTLQNELAGLTSSGVAQVASTETEQSSDEPLDTGSRALRNFIALNAVAVIRSNIDGEIFEANQAFCDLLGHTQEEVRSGLVRWTNITSPQYVSESTSAVRQLVTVGKAAPFEKEYIHKDGHLVPVLVVILSLGTTGDGLLSGDDWLVFILDLSKQKMAERLLKFSEAEFRHLTESIPQIVWVTDNQSNLIYANQKLYDFSGFTLNDSKGTNWQNIIHPDDIGKFVDSWKKSASYANVYEMEVRYRQADGHYKWFLARTAPVTNEQNEVLMWVGTSTDIDEQKHQENELKESELQYRTLADAIPQIVWTASPEGDIDFFNHRWFEYTGLTRNQSIDQGWTLLIHPEDRDEYLTDWQQALKSGDTYEKEFRLRRAIGIGTGAGNQYRWHLSRAVALRGENGEIQKWFATWTEIEGHKSN